MSLSINTKEGAEKRVEALEKIIKDKKTDDTVKQCARQRLQYWKARLSDHQMKEANEHIDLILDSLE